MGCTWGHEWGKWEVAEKGPIVDSGATHPEMKGWTVGYYLRQERRCQRCHFTELSIQHVLLDPAAEASVRAQEAYVKRLGGS